MDILANCFLGLFKRFYRLRFFRTGRAAKEARVVFHPLFGTGCRWMTCWYCSSLSPENLGRRDLTLVACTAYSIEPVGLNGMTCVRGLVLHCVLVGPDRGVVGCPRGFWVRLCEPAAREVLEEAPTCSARPNLFRLELSFAHRHWPIRSSSHLWSPVSSSPCVFVL